MQIAPSGNNARISRNGRKKTRKNVAAPSPSQGKSEITKGINFRVLKEEKRIVDRTHRRPGRARILT